MCNFPSHENLCKSAVSKFPILYFQPIKYLHFNSKFLNFFESSTVQAIHNITNFLYKNHTNSYEFVLKFVHKIREKFVHEFAREFAHEFVHEFIPEGFIFREKI